MGSKTTSSSICKKGILHADKTKDKKEKSVTIVEDDSAQRVKISQERKRVKQYKEIYRGIVKHHIERQRKAYEKLMQEYNSNRKNRMLTLLLVSIPLAWLLFMLIWASLCHAYNPQCDIFLHETVIASVFSIFASSPKEKVFCK